MNVIHRVLGANWKNAVSGIGATLFAGLSALAIAPYQLGDIATIIPPEYKTKLFIAAGLASFVLRVWNSTQQKNKDVVGGSIQQTISGKVAAPGTQTLVDQTLIASDLSGEILSPKDRATLQTII